MALDYTQGCVNFRDVGEWINLISGEARLPERRILRGGKLDFVRTADEIGRPGTIVNLRGGPDPDDCHFGADYRHFPTSNNLEKYETSTSDVRRWLQEIFLALERDVDRYPVLFHCTSGKDRTGVVVAVLLAVLGIERGLIVEEYLLSDGEVHEDRIQRSLDGVGDPATYFRRVDLEVLRHRVL